MDRHFLKTRYTHSSAPALLAALQERILLLDGAMGTMIQALAFDESAYRGTQWAEHPVDLQGNNDLLNLTQPEAIKRIHLAYLRVGADIISTNTFNSTAIAQDDYALAMQHSSSIAKALDSPGKPPTRFPRKLRIAHGL